MANRYKITIEYIGTGLAGWQKQNNALSVQQLLEEAIYQFSREKVGLFAAGRTDAGVHALGQVAHFELIKYYDPYRVMQAINHFVKPYLVGVVNSEVVGHDFHARFSAKARHYLYKIVNRPGKIIVNLNRAWWIKQVLDVESMIEGASYLIGTHDFTSFRAKHCQAKSPIKTLSRIEVITKGEEVHFYLLAPSFLHHMVRNIVGSLVLVGLGKWKAENIKTVLDAKIREVAGATAPACGLYFLKVDY